VNRFDYVLQFLLLSAGALAVTAVLAGPAHADEKRHTYTLQRKLPVANLCVNVDSNPTCDAAFAAALQSVNTSASAANESADIVVTAARAANTGSHGMQPLKFQKRAPWVRRLETIGKEGIPFVRVPRGPESELIVGINRKGVLGFQLKQTANH
jgi:hypothetical protein